MLRLLHLPGLPRAPAGPRPPGQPHTAKRATSTDSPSSPSSTRRNCDCRNGQRCSTQSFTGAPRCLARSTFKMCPTCLHHQNPMWRAGIPTFPSSSSSSVHSLFLQLLFHLLHDDPPCLRWTHDELDLGPSKGGLLMKTSSLDRGRH